MSYRGKVWSLILLVLAIFWSGVVMYFWSM